MARAALRFDPIGLDKDLTGVLADFDTPAARSRLIADTAREMIADADTKNAAASGRPVPKTIHVDGLLDAPLESVRPDGTILATWDAMNPIVWYVWEILVLNSPYGQDDPRPGHPGMYSKSHELFADGERVELAEGQPFPDANVFTFLSTVPYARKIERGLSKQSPDGVYQVTTSMARRRFGRMAAIDFRYIAPTFGGISAWAQQKSARTLAKNIRGGNAAAHNEWLRRQPAVVISRYA